MLFRGTKNLNGKYSNLLFCTQFNWENFIDNNTMDKKHEDFNTVRFFLIFIISVYIDKDDI